jgi:hypothetical protein
MQPWLLALVFPTLTGISEDQLEPSIMLSSVLGIHPKELYSLVTATIVAIFTFSAIATCIVNEIDV